MVDCSHCILQEDWIISSALTSVFEGEEPECNETGVISSIT